MKTYLVRGVPSRMQEDGWWLNPQSDSKSDKMVVRRGHLWRLGLLAALVAIGDLLLWQVTPGLSLAVFAALCLGAAAILWPGEVPARRRFLAAALALMTCLPIVELVQPLSVAFFLAGIPLTLAALTGRRLRGMVRFWWAGPVFTLKDAATIAQVSPSRNDLAASVQKFLLTWALPLGVGFVFAGLILSANPVLDQFLTELTEWHPNIPNPARIAFWSGLALILWPLLALLRFAPRLSPDPSPPRLGPVRIPGLINGPSIARSLVLFNGLFALQNVMDLAFLAGGVGLPEGMTYAEYAHRGAYPLVVLALLSGGFALLVRPFITAAPILRVLLLIWVAQTVWLTCSSLLRLDLYVETYGLTRLRIAAAIWMGLVASGLCLTLWQIVKGHSNLWLIRRVAALGVSVLWLSCFASFDAAIARYNLTHQVKLDHRYLCQLGEAARPVIERKTKQDSRGFCRGHYYVAFQVNTPKDWREWGFRNARVRRSLTTLQEQRTNEYSQDPHY